MSRAPIWTLANGYIDTTSRSGVDGGVYNTSIETEIYLTPIEIVESVPINVPNLPTCGVSPLPERQASCQLTQRSKCASTPNSTWGLPSAALPVTTPVFAGRCLSLLRTGTVFSGVPLRPKRRSRQIIGTHSVWKGACSQPFRLREYRLVQIAALVQNVSRIRGTR